MNPPALALASFVFVGFSVGAMLAIPLLIFELNRRERWRANLQSRANLQAL